MPAHTFIRIHKDIEVRMPPKKACTKEQQDGKA